ncbi:MAG: carboxypeptidase-like regulatory domain-containing protein [Fibrobacter sp.]|nr:carboxypeptidase-like regulatory domain-containing protein [Fibrobacter sp.]
MSKFVLKSSVLVAFALAACFVGCTIDTAGTVTDTGNTVAGVVYRADGSEASDAVVRMARMRVDNGVGVPDLIEVTTDSNGAYSFDSVLADTFQLAVIDAAVSEIFYLPRTTRKTKGLDKITLSKAAVFKSSLVYEDVAEPAVQVGSHFIVGVSGTPFYESVFAGDTFEILMPEGDWWMEFYPGDAQIVAKLQNSGVSDTIVYRTWSMDGELEAGDTLEIGPFIWSPTAEIDSLIKESEEEAKDVSRISGQVFCKNGKACEGVEVNLITDLYGFGFEGDSLKFNAMTTTDSTGRWWLNVPKEVPEDSFRVEYRRIQDDVVTQTGTSRYVLKKEVKDLKDTLDLGVDTLGKAAGLVSKVNVIIDKNDSTQSNNCMLNSVVVGIKGTSHFVRDVACETFVLRDMPAGAQEVVLYSGDRKVMEKMLESDAPSFVYLTLTGVTLPEGAIQQIQGMTYQVPSQNIFENPLASEE